MKLYEKPRLMVLSISANDMLCSGCSICTRGDYYWDPFDLNHDGVLTHAEATSQGLFGSSDGENSDSCSVPVDGYCKFNGTDPALVFTS